MSSQSEDELRRGTETDSDLQVRLAHDAMTSIKAARDAIGAAEAAFRTSYNGPQSELGSQISFDDLTAHVNALL